MVRHETATGNLKRRGRPPVASASVRVSVRIAVETYDRLDRIARRHETTVPDVIRRRLSVLENN
jgi:hypothetical protein